MDTYTINVLLVEDDKFTRAVYLDRIKHPQKKRIPPGIQIHIETATDGEEAFTYLRAHPREIDVVISDVMMARMDGWMLLDAIRNDLKLNEIELPVVIMSAFNSDELEVRAHLHKANAWYIKDKPSITVDKLLDEILFWGNKSGDPDLTPVPELRALTEMELRYADEYDDDTTVPDLSADVRAVRGNTGANTGANANPDDDKTPVPTPKTTI